MTKVDKLQRILKYLALDFAGIILFVIGWRCFIFPNKGGVGGFAGIASLIGYILNRDDLGSFLFLMNIPFLVLAFIFLSKEVCIKSAFTMAAISLTSNLFGKILPDCFLPTFCGNRLIFCICGAILSGVGLGWIFKSGSTSGGSDIVSMLVKRKYPKVKVGTIIFYFDVVVIGLSAVVYKDIASALYGVLDAFICTQILNKMLYKKNNHAGARMGHGKSEFTQS